MTENQDHQRYSIVVGAGMVTVEDVLTDHPPVIFQGQDRLIKAVDYCDRMNNHPDQDALQKLSAPAAFLATELPAFTAWQRDRVERVAQAREAEEEAHRAYVSAVARRVVIELETPPLPAERESEPRSPRPGPSVGTGPMLCSCGRSADSPCSGACRTPSGPQRCSCGVSAGMAHDCETAGRIS